MTATERLLLGEFPQPFRRSSSRMVSAVKQLSPQWRQTTIGMFSMTVKSSPQPYVRVTRLTVAAPLPQLSQINF